MLIPTGTGSYRFRAAEACSTWVSSPSTRFIAECRQAAVRPAQQTLSA